MEKEHCYVVQILSGTDFNTKHCLLWPQQVMRSRIVCLAVRREIHPAPQGGGDKGSIN